MFNPMGGLRQIRAAAAPLRYREFRLFFVGRAASLLGSAFAPIAAAFAVIAIDGRPADLAWLVAAQVGPQVIFMLVGGVFSDRLPRNLIMVFSHVVNFCLQATAAVLLLTGRGHVWELIVLTLMRGISSAFFLPAAGGIVPMLVPQEELQRANSLLQLTNNGTQVLGAASAGIVVSLVGPGWAYGADALSFLIGALFLLKVTLPPMTADPRGAFLNQLKDGWREFASRRWIWIVVAQFALINSLGTAAFTVLGPFIADDRLGGAWAWGVILSSQVAGMMCGSILGFVVKAEHPLRVALPAVSLTALPLLLLALAAPLPAIAFAALASGCGLQVFTILWETSLQRSVPLDRLSRVSSYDAAGSFAFMPFGVIALAPAAQLIGITSTLIASTVIVATAAFAALIVTDIRNFVPGLPEPEGAES